MSEPRQHKAFVSFSVSLLWAGPNNARNQQRDGFTQAGGVLASSQVQNEEQTLPEGLSTSATPAPACSPSDPARLRLGPLLLSPLKPSATALIGAGTAVESSFLQKTLLQLSLARLGSPTHAT